MIRRAARWLQRLLFVIGFMILGYCGADWVNSRLQQSAGNQELDRILSENTQSAPKSSIPDGELVGRVEIPKLRLSAVVFQGTDNNVLDRGVGHLDSSALPDEPGNVVLAAHRDTFFRSLRNITQGDEITMTTTSSLYSCRVDSPKILGPSDCV